MVSTAVCETAMKLTVRTVFRYGVTAVSERAVKISVHALYRYGRYCCV
jgi:hypothetical protein